MFVIYVFQLHMSAERERRHLEGHDKVCEVKLGLQVQLDGHVLHTCRKKDTAVKSASSRQQFLARLNTHPRKYLQTLTAYVYAADRAASFFLFVPTYKANQSLAAALDCVTAAHSEIPQPIYV